MNKTTKPIANGTATIVRWRPIKTEPYSTPYGHGQAFEVWLADGRRGELSNGCGAVNDLNVVCEGGEYKLGQLTMPGDLSARLEGIIVKSALRYSLNIMGAISTLNFLLRLTAALDKVLQSVKPGEAEGIIEAIGASEAALCKFDCLMAAKHGSDLVYTETMLMDFAAAVQRLMKRVSALAKKPVGFRGKVTDHNVCGDDRICDSLEDLLALKLEQAGQARTELAEAVLQLELLSSGEGKVDSGIAAVKRAPKSNRGVRKATR